MTNTMDFNKKTMQAATMAIMNDVLSSNIEGKTKNELYFTVRKHINITREKFNEVFAQASKKLSSWKNEGRFLGGYNELDEKDLDVIV